MFCWGQKCSLSWWQWLIGCDHVQKITKLYTEGVFILLYKGYYALVNFNFLQDDHQMSMWFWVQQSSLLFSIGLYLH